jgi:arylsulfatase A-like enzyme
MNRLASRGVRRISWAMVAATWVVGAGVATCPPAGAQSAERPNILWLIAEDFGNDLGCTGVAEASTPRIDALARNGMRFSRFFTTCPVCSPSRSAFMTGMYQTTIGAHNHRSHRHDDHRLPDGVRLLTEWFRDAGYYTANVVELPPEAGFRGTGKTDWNFTPPERPFDGDRWSDLAGHQPFFAQINFQETHRKFNGTKRADPAKVEVPPYEPDHPVARADRAAYLDAGTELDRKVGVVLDQLKRDGLADSTIVVLFGDNGEAHVRGKQFCYEEGLHTPLVIRWPSKFPIPANYARGAVDDRLLMSIDLAPTMLSLAGADVPDAMQGDVFLGDATAPARKYVFAGRDRCDETVFRFRTVRDDRYRYIRNFTPDRPFLQANRYKESQYPVWSLLKELDGKGELTPAQQALTAPTMPAEELYDLESDPHEIHNLAGDAAHAETLARMRGELERWIDESNDQGRIPETEEVIRREGSPRRVPARQSR